NSSVATRRTSWRSRNASSNGQVSWPLGGSTRTSVTSTYSSPSRSNCGSTLALVTANRRACRSAAAALDQLVLGDHRHLHPPEAMLGHYRTAASTPVDRLLAGLGEGGVDGGERPGTQEPAGIERTGVAGFDYRVRGSGHQRGLAPGVRAPQGEHHPLRTGVQGPDRGVGQVLPTASRVRAGRARAYRQHRV